MDDLLPEFLAETGESLAELDLALVKLERSPDDKATLSLIFRLVHTIKGTCGFLGLPRLERVAHAAENVLGRVRDGELRATPDVITQVLGALDGIKAILAGLAATGTEPDSDDAALIAALDRVAAGGEAKEGTGDAAAVTEPLAPAAPRAVEAETMPPGETIRVSAAAPASPERVAAESPTGAQSIRVTVDVLEGLMNLVGELVLTRNQLLQLSRAHGTTEFGAPLQRLSHITSDLQEGVMKTRMQPIGSAWNKLPRLVRDLAQETGKKIRLEMRGQDTELDRQVLELMRDPLTHMVRNSADHGLEAPGDRRAAGKPEVGRIMLNAFHEGGHIIIEISDDGRGLDVGRIRAKVLSRGLATEAELAAMPDAQIRSFIFRPGFSTAETVTAISGRGVGMDVVRANIERIGGIIDLASTPGAGSCFTIRIPLTLAIVSALIVQAGGGRFAIPQISVIELVSAARQARPGGGPAIERIGEASVLRLRDRLLPLVSLAGLLQLNEGEPAGDSLTIVVTAAGGGLLGIMVDEVFDTEEIVVKPVAPILRHVTMFSGNTILGDGTVIMILDPNGIARSAGVSARAGAENPPSVTGNAIHSDDQVPLLLFRAGGTALHAVPLSLVARLESMQRARIERCGGGLVTQYRGRLMPMIALNGAGEDGALDNDALQPVLVFADGERSMGLMVDAIIDVVQDRLRVELGGARPGLLGTAIIAGQAADVLDTAHFLSLAWGDWLTRRAGQLPARPRILVVEDSRFFRQLLVPTLSAAGYEVVAAESAAEALRLRDGGLMVDAIVSDIDMPDIDGLGLARMVREGGAWCDLPMIALTGRDGAGDAGLARAAGFTEYVQKSQREALIARLVACLAEPAQGRALAA
jgi:two-component system chemotaxis sensor kinase CheA